ncbi:MAG: hypothetical protein GY765_12110, partial [bacterium]|nr:hypothetical protein [bacterium]
EEAVTQQIATLNSLIQLIEDSGFAIDKRVEALLAKLTDIADHLSQYKSNGQWQKAVDMVEKQLKPALQSSRELFGGWRGSDSSVIGETASALETAVQSFESQVTGMLEKVADQQQMQTLDINQKTAHLPQAVKGVLENLPAGMQSVENISQLSEVITEVLDKNPDFLTSMDGSSSMPSEVKDMLSSLRSHFKPIDIGEGALKLAPKLKAVVEDSGIFFEKKVGEAVSRLTEASDRLAGIKSMGRLPEIRDIIANDLKPNLLALQEYLETEHLVTDPAQREALETIKEAVDDLVKNIHSQQDRAVDTQNQQQQPYQMFSFSIPIKGEEEAKLKVFYNKKGKKGGEGEFKLSMLLDMDKMGEVRTDFFHTKKNLAVTFYVKDEEIKEYLEESFHEVAEMVEEDYESVAMSVAVSSDKIAEFETEASPPEEIISDKAVDVKV